MLYMSAIVVTCLAEFDGILTLQWGGSQSGRPFHPLGLLNPREDSSILSQQPNSQRLTLRRNAR